MDFSIFLLGISFLCTNCEEQNHHQIYQPNSIWTLWNKTVSFQLHFQCKNLPELEINENLPILICPDILHSSQITISKISLFNTLDSNQVLPADSELMYFAYGEPDSILSVPSTQAQIYKDDWFLSTIIQSNFPRT